MYHIHSNSSTLSVSRTWSWCIMMDSKSDLKFLHFWHKKHRFHHFLCANLMMKRGVYILGHKCLLEWIRYFTSPEQCIFCIKQPDKFWCSAFVHGENAHHSVCIQNLVVNVFYWILHGSSLSTANFAITVLMYSIHSVDRPITWYHYILEKFCWKPAGHWIIK